MTTDLIFSIYVWAVKSVFMIENLEELLQRLKLLNLCKQDIVYETIVKRDQRQKHELMKSVCQLE